MRELRQRTWSCKGFDLKKAKDVRLVGCRFESCSISNTLDPKQMARIENVEIVDCTDLNSSIGPCSLTDVRVQHLKTGDIMLVWAPKLTRVSLGGKIGRIKINDTVQLSRTTEAQKESWKRARAEHYDKVDWAIDISAARPLMLELDGIPTDKIRRDPETQIVVSKTALREQRQVDAIPELDDVTRFSLESFISNEPTEKLLVAPIGRTPKLYRPVLASFAALRRAGLAS